MEEQPLATGTILDKKYLIVSPIAEGAMGWVYQAEHLVLLHPVALKVLRPSCAKSEAVRARLRREAQILARLRSPHTVRITDASFPQDDRQYIAMEFVSGQELAGYIAERLPLPVPMAVKIVAQVCHSLSEAHQLDVVHRDVKPENVLLETIEPSLKVRLIDFGVAKELDTKASPSHTIRDGKLGTPGYMAPEQLLDPGSVDARADVFSVGVLLFELLAGRLPFVEDAEEIGLAAWMNPMRLDDLNPAVDSGIVRIVERCLSVDPRDRYPSAVELKAELDVFVEPTEVHDDLRESEPPEVAFEVPCTLSDSFFQLRQIDASQKADRSPSALVGTRAARPDLDPAGHAVLTTPVLSPRPRRSPGILAAAVVFSALFSFGAAYGAGLGDLLVDNVFAPPHLGQVESESRDSVAATPRNVAAHTLAWPAATPPEPERNERSEELSSSAGADSLHGFKLARARGSAEDRNLPKGAQPSGDFELSDPWSAQEGVKGKTGDGVTPRSDDDAHSSQSGDPKSDSAPQDPHLPTSSPMRDGERRSPSDPLLNSPPNSM